MVRTRTFSCGSVRRERVSERSFTLPLLRVRDATSDPVMTPFLIWSELVMISAATAVPASATNSAMTATMSDGESRRDVVHWSASFGRVVWWIRRGRSGWRLGDGHRPRRRGVAGLLSKTLAAAVVTYGKPHADPLPGRAEPITSSSARHGTIRALCGRRTSTETSAHRHGSEAAASRACRKPIGFGDGLRCSSEQQVVVDVVVFALDLLRRQPDLAE